MKRFACYIVSLLILLSLAGCAGTNTLQESKANSTVSTDTAIAPNITPMPTLCDFDVDIDVDIETTIVPNVTFTPIPCIFNVDSVKMQATPQSSCFSEIGYDSDWGILVVRFRDSGSVYTYSNFPKGEWSKFVSTDSLGRWYNKYIKGKYKSERIY